jgi:hypothetical protein
MRSRHSSTAAWQRSGIVPGIQPGNLKAIYQLRRLLSFPNIDGRFCIMKLYQLPRSFILQQWKSARQLNVVGSLSCLQEAPHSTSCKPDESSPHKPYLNTLIPRFSRVRTSWFRKSGASPKILSLWLFSGYKHLYKSYSHTATYSRCLKGEGTVSITTFLQRKTPT